VKTNGITSRIFSSVIFTNGNNSISTSVGIYRQKISVSDTVGLYRRNKFVGIYRPYHRQIIQFFGMLQRCDDVNFFSDAYTDGMTEGFKPGSPYSDVAHSPVESPTGIPMEGVRR
jgi:hypothetical protein